MEVSGAGEPVLEPTSDSGESGVFVVTRLPEPGCTGLVAAVVSAAAVTGIFFGGLAIWSYSLSGNACASKRLAAFFKTHSSTFRKSRLGKRWRILVTLTTECVRGYGV